MNCSKHAATFIRCILQEVEMKIYAVCLKKINSRAFEPVFHLASYLQ
jgi:hypothetical protein